MKLPFKSVGISTIVHATEDENKLRKVLRSLLPDDAEIEKSEVEGHYGDFKAILSAKIRRRPFLRKFWNRVLKKLADGEREWLSEKAIERIGDDCRLYLRFGKQLAVSDDELSFSEAGDVIHVRINISAYPAKKEIAIEKVSKFIDSGLNF